MTISPSDLKALHAAYDQAQEAQKACRAVAAALSAVTARLEEASVTVDVPCAYCPERAHVTLTVQSKTVPLQDVCASCRSDQPKP